MAHFYRLIFTLLAFVSCNVHAEQPASFVWVWTLSNATQYPDAQTACTTIGKGNYNATHSYAPINQTTYAADCKDTTSGTTNFSIAGKYVCPAGETQTSLGFCSGTAPPVCDPAGSNLSRGYPVTVGESTNDAGSGCFGGCGYNLVPDSLSVGSKDVSGNWVYSRKLGSSTGVSCTGSIAPVTNPPPQLTPQQKCTAAGQSYGTVNGVVTCVPRATAGAEPTKSKDASNQTQNKPNGDVINVTNNVSTVTNNDGSVTVTTSRTTTTNGVAVTETDSKTDTPQGTCVDNPNVSICKETEKSSYTPACDQPPQCKGDAILCAIANRAYKDRCEADDAKALIVAKSAYTKGDKLLNGEYDADVQDFMNKTGDSVRNVDIPSSISESGNASFAGEGMQDITNTVMGRTFTLPLSNYNKYLEYMGYILVALSYVASLKIVMSAV